MSAYSDDVDDIKPKLLSLPRDWDGKTCVLQMKEEQYHWRQVEWWAFYFELLCRRCVCPPLAMPGERDGRVTWDAKGRINWDLKAKAVKTDSDIFILNDRSAMHASVERFGEHGVIIALCDVEYNDEDRTFQRWRTALQGGKSKYTQEREKRTSNSRYRKTKANLVEILFVRLDAAALERLGEMKQGRNSNGKPRPRKFLFDERHHSDLITHRLRLD